MKRLPFLALVLALPSQAMAQGLQPCELHIWPTTNYFAETQGLAILLGLPGMVADAAAHQGPNERIKALLARDLSPAAQVEELGRAQLAQSLKMPADTVIIVEESLPGLDLEAKDPAIKARTQAMNQAANLGQRLSASTARCYGEILVSAIGFGHSPLDGTSLNVRWLVRRWDGGSPKLFNSERRILFTGFSANPSANPGAATQDSAIALRTAFARNFSTWAAKKIK